MATQTDEEKQRIAAQMQGSNSAAQANQAANAQANTQARTAAAVNNANTQNVANTQNSAAAASYPFQRNFQAPSAAQPGQQTPMPWSGLAPNLGNLGRGGATPWAQTMQAPQTPVQGQQAAAPGGMPNWQALLQRFGGGGGGQTASPAFQPQAFNPLAALAQRVQGPQGAAPNFLQNIAAQIAARSGQGLPIANQPASFAANPYAKPGRMY